MSTRGWSSTSAPTAAARSPSWVLEKLAHRVIVWDVVGWHPADSYPLDARRCRRGPSGTLRRDGHGSLARAVRACRRLVVNRGLADGPVLVPDGVLFSV